jgi:hypothetical protein
MDAGCGRNPKASEAAAVGVGQVPAMRRTFRVFTAYRRRKRFRLA